MKYFLAFAVLALVAAFYVDGKAAPPINYVADLQLSYENDLWHCDMIICPEGTFGCRIQRNNDVLNKAKLVRTNICYGKNNATMMLVLQKTDLNTEITVKVDINSYEGAESVFGVGFSRDSQSAWGVVAANDWEMFQKTFVDNMFEIDQSA